ncbi:MAG: oligosaccharide flippase family protein [FCB group bacterium]|nr:oligosaccharide flippase family protein [FCB group bacterium]
MIRHEIIRLSKQTLVYGFGYVVARMINFLLLPFYSHHLAPSEYAVISLIYAFIAFMNIFYHYGLESAFLRFYSGAGLKEACEKKDVFTTVLFSLIITGAIFSLLIAFSAKGVSQVLLRSDQYAHIIRLTALILLLDALFLIPLHYLRINNKAAVFTTITLINVLINVGLNIYLIRFRGMGIEGVFIGNIAASGFNVLILIPIVIRNWNWRISPSLWKKMLLFGLPFVPGGLSSMIIELSDRYMLQGFRGLEEVGLYSAGHKLGIFMMLVVMAFRFAWQPFFLQKHKDPQAPYLFSKIMTWFVFIMTIIFLSVTFFIHEIVSFEILGRHFIQEGYWEGMVVVPYILAAYLFNGIYIMFHPAIFYSGKTWVVSLIVGIAACVNVGLNLLLIPRLGMTAAGISSLSAYMFMALATYLIVKKWMPVRYEWKNLLVMSVLTIGALLIYLLSPQAGAAVKILIVVLYITAVMPFIYPRKRKINRDA